GPAAATEVRILGLGAELRARHRAETERADAQQFRGGVDGALDGAFAHLLFTAGFVGSVALVVERGIRGSASVGDVVLVVLLANAIAAQLRMMMIGIGISLQGMALVSRVLAIFRLAAPRTRAAAPLLPPDRLQ